MCNQSKKNFYFEGSCSNLHKNDYNSLIQSTLIFFLTFSWINIWGENLMLDAILTFDITFKFPVRIVITNYYIGRQQFHYDPFGVDNTP